MATLSSFISGYGGCSGSAHPFAQISKLYGGSGAAQNHFGAVSHASTSSFRQQSTPSTSDQLANTFFGAPTAQQPTPFDLFALRAALLPPAQQSSAQSTPPAEMYESTGWASDFTMDSSVQTSQRPWIQEPVFEQPRSASTVRTSDFAERQLVLGWCGRGIMGMHPRLAMTSGSHFGYQDLAPTEHSLYPLLSTTHAQAPLSTSFPLVDTVVDATDDDWEAAFSVAHEDSRTDTVEMDTAEVIDYTFNSTHATMAAASIALTPRTAIPPPHSVNANPSSLADTTSEVSSPSPLTAQEHLQSALRFQTMERDPAAIISLLLALDLDHSLGEAWLALGVSYANERRWEDAIEAWESWVECLGQPGTGSGRSKRGEWVSGRGDGLGVGEVEWLSRDERWGVGAFGGSNSYADIVARWKAARSFRAEERATVGTLPPLTFDERSSELIEVLIELAQARMEVDPEVQVGLGVLLNAAGMYAQASDCFAAALEVKPEDALILNRLGASLANQNETELAIHYYSEALLINPTFVRARYNLSMVARTLERYEEATTELLTCIMVQQEDYEARSRDDTAPTGQLTSRSLWNALASSFALLYRRDLAQLAEDENLVGLLAALA